MVDCSWFIGEPTMIVAIIYLPGRYGQLRFTVDVSYQMIHIIIYIYIYYYITLHYIALHYIILLFYIILYYMFIYIYYEYIYIYIHIYMLQ